MEIGVGLILLGLGIAGLGCCRSATLALDSAYDTRPFELAGIDTKSLPFLQFDSILENLRRGWLLNAAAPAATSVAVAAGAAPGKAVVVVNPAVPEWGGGGGGASPRATSTGTVMLAPNSHLALSSQGLIEVKERCCLTKRRSLTFAERVRWVRAPMPNPCVCCSSLEMGTAADGKIIEAPMDAMHTSSLMAALKPAMMLRASARSSSSTLTACSPQWNCQCPKKTLTIDADFTTITTQPTACSCTGSTTLFRTEDVPWIYSERSATLWFQGIASLVLILALFIAAGSYVAVDPVLGFLALLAVPLAIAILSCVGLVSFSAVASLCCTFTVVNLGTPGSAASEDSDGLRASNAPLLVCCCLFCTPCALLLLLRPLLCSRAVGISRVYNCEAQGATQSRAFVAAAKASIAAANAARRRAAAAGASGEGKGNTVAAALSSATAATAAASAVGGGAGVTVVVA